MLIKLYQLEHATYTCQYHMVWIPRYRGKVLADKFIKQELKGFTIIAWHIGDDHIHLYVVISPKYSVSYAIQVLKSKSANWLKKKTKKFPRGNFWARGYFVSTIGINEHIVLNYIKKQDYKRIDIEKAKLF